MKPINHLRLGIIKIVILLIINDLITFIPNHDFLK